MSLCVPFSKVNVWLNHVSVGNNGHVQPKIQKQMDGKYSPINNNKQ